MNKNSKFEQAQLLTIPNGSAAGVAVPFKVQLNRDYKRCKGIALYDISNPNSDKLNMQVVNKTGEVIQTVSVEHYKVSANVTPNDRYKKIDIDPQIEVTVNVVPIANTTAQILLQVIFLLTDEA